MKTFRSIIIVIVLILIAASEIQCSKPANNTTTQVIRNETSSKVVDVDELVKHPDAFKGSIGVMGTVKQIDESKGAFILGCEDACVVLPVAFKGKMPAVGAEVTVYGEVTKVESQKYIFAAREIKLK